MKERFNPEERLLRIIESDKDNSFEPQNKTRLQGISTAPASVFLKIFKIFKFENGLKGVNFLLGIFSIGLSLFFVFDFIKGFTRTKSQLGDLEDLTPIVLENKRDPVLELDEETALFFNRAEKRNIFSYSGNITAPLKVEKEEVQDLKLVGIMWSDLPEAMVEFQGKTYLIKEGDTLLDFKIKEVLRDGVVLEKEGRRWFLK